MKVYLLPDHTKARKIHFQILKTDVHQFEQNSSEYFIDKTINHWETINLYWQNYHFYWQNYQSLLTAIFIVRLERGKREWGSTACRQFLTKCFGWFLKIEFLLSIHWHFYSLWCLWKQYGRGRCGCQYGTGAYPWNWKAHDK